MVPRAWKGVTGWVTAEAAQTCSTDGREVRGRLSEQAYLL